jgi:hypothetical protein
MKGPSIFQELMKKGSAGHNRLVVSSQNKPVNRNFMARKNWRKIFALKSKIFVRPISGWAGIGADVQF